MEILQFLLSFLTNGYGEKLKPLFELMQKNDFDIKKILRNVDMQTVAPIIKDFMEKGAKNRPERNSERSECGLSPIAGIADKDIVYTLNKYFCQEV